MRGRTVPTPPSSRVGGEQRERRWLKLQGCQASANGKQSHTGPLPNHNNNHSRSAFHKFQHFPGIFFLVHHFASVSASQRSMTVKYRSFQPLSGQIPISVFLHFLSLFSQLEVLSSPHCQVRVRRGEDVLMRDDAAVTFGRTPSGQRCNTI